MIAKLSASVRQIFGYHEESCENLSRVRKRRSILPIRTPSSKRQKLTFTNIKAKTSFEDTLYALSSDNQLESLPYKVQLYFSDFISSPLKSESPKIPAYKSLVHCRTPRTRSSSKSTSKEVKTNAVVSQTKKTPRATRVVGKSILKVIQSYTKFPLNTTRDDSERFFGNKVDEMSFDVRKICRSSPRKSSSRKYPVSKSLPDPEPIVLESDSSDDDVEKQAAANTRQLRSMHVIPESYQDMLSCDFLKRNGALNQYAELIERYKSEKSEIKKSTARYQKFCSDHISKKIESLSREPPLTRVRFPEKEPEYPQLTDDMQREIDFILGPGDPNEELVKAFAIPIKRRDIRTLIGLEWLNDEIINFYLNLIADRSKNNSNLPKCHIMNTFFYSRLLDKGFSGVSRWTRRVDLFSFDFILIPIHLRVHWCLAWIDISNKKITYFDSMGAPNDQCLHTLANYLPAEHLDKKKTDLPMDDWVISNATDIPHQRNASDCGVFAMTFAEHISSGKPFKFSQKQMPYFRRKMAYEIVNQGILE